MKVKEFIKLLLEQDQDAEVIISKDSEGNGYSPCCGFENMVYIPDSTYSGEVKMHKKDLTKEMIRRGWGEEDCYDPDDNNGVDAVVLYSTN